MKQLLEKLERGPGSHKGENGRVGVIGGSADYTGAPALSARAAMRTGCDLARIVTSESSHDVVAGFSESFIVESYQSDFLELSGVEKCLETIRWSDATVIGPGLGEPEAEAVEKIVERAQSPLVIDADAIEPSLEADFSKAVFTPHSGELEQIKQKFNSVENFVDETDAVVVVKGEVDGIYTPREVFENETGHSNMTVGGTGDVLTGIIASMISQGLDRQEAARLGVWLNGKAGEIAAGEHGNGALATDIVDLIPEVLK